MLPKKLYILLYISWLRNIKAFNFMHGSNIFWNTFVFSGHPDIRFGCSYTQLQLDRATNRSYLDYEKEIVLPKDEMEHVLSCVYTDIPGELSLSYEVILSYITPVNDVSDLIIRETGQQVNSLHIKLLIIV